MKTSPITQTIAYCFSLLSFTMLTAQNPAPGGVQGAGMWYHQADDSAIIGNRHTFNLLAFEDSLQTRLPREITSTTFFLVLRPAFESARGKEFLQMGGLKLYDDKLVHNGVTTPLDFTDRHPKILTVRSQRVPSYGTRYFPPVQLQDSSLFELAELIYYPGLKDHNEIQKVHSYLALKYSITITENSVPERRNYLKKDSTMYWNEAIDGLFDQRVIGIGNSEDERFTQPQTATSFGSFLLVSLDTVKPLGQMPGVFIHEDAFIVLSQRRSQGLSTLACEGDREENPLWDWKFRPHNWLSTATELVIRVEKPRATLTDSLQLFDGYNRWNLTHTMADSNTVEYRIPLSILSNGRHYFFVRTDMDPCDSIEIGTTANGELYAYWPVNEEESWKLETRNLDNGLVISERVQGESAGRILEDGQYLVTIRDGEDQEMKTGVVYVTKSENPTEHLTETSEILLFPNPATTGGTVHLQAQGLEAKAAQLVVTDSRGRVLKQEQIAASRAEAFTRELTFAVSGVYYITIHQGGTSYGRKAVITQ